MPDEKPDEKQVTMKGREEYEALLASMPTNSSDFHDNMMGMTRMQTELLMDIRDFAFGSQNLQKQHVAFTAQFLQAIKMLEVIANVVVNWGIEKKWLKKPIQDPNLDATLKDSSGFIDLSKLGRT
jgi:hypothetical protein